MLPIAGGRPIQVAIRGNLTRRCEDGAHRTRQSSILAIARFCEPDWYARGVETEADGRSPVDGSGGYGIAGFTDSGPVRRQHPPADELPAQDPLGAGDVHPPLIGRYLEEF